MLELPSKPTTTATTYNPIVKIFSLPSGLPVVKLKCPQALEGTLLMLVDTGSDKSICRLDKLKPDVPFNAKHFTEFTGIAGIRKSIGSAFLNMKFGRKVVVI